MAGRLPPVYITVLTERGLMKQMCHNHVERFLGKTQAVLYIKNKCKLSKIMATVLPQINLMLDIRALSVL